MLLQQGTDCLRRDIPASIALDPALLGYQTPLVSKATTCGEIAATKGQVSKTNRETHDATHPVSVQTLAHGSREKKKDKPLLPRAVPHRQHSLARNSWPCSQGHSSQDLPGWLSPGDACSAASSPKALPPCHGPRRAFRKQGTAELPHSSEGKRSHSREPTAKTTSQNFCPKPLVTRWRPPVSSYKSQNGRAGVGRDLRGSSSPAPEDLRQESNQGKLNRNTKRSAPSYATAS